MAKFVSLKRITITTYKNKFPNLRCKAEKQGGTKTPALDLHLT